MKLIIKQNHDLPGSPICLFTEEGHILPMQKDVTIFTEAGEMPMLTVNFIIDGAEIRLAESDPATRLDRSRFEEARENIARGARCSADGAFRL
jgi:hypothetical protein